MLISFAAPAQLMCALGFAYAGADPGFQKRGFKCRKGGFVCLILHKIS